MSLIKEVFNADTQADLYKLVKNVHVLDHGDTVSVPDFIAERFDSDYKQGVDRANGSASDGKRYDFGTGEWQEPGDNKPCAFFEAMTMVFKAIIYGKLEQIQRQMKHYYTVKRLSNGQQKISYTASLGQEHQVANHALNSMAQMFYSTQNDALSGMFDDEVSDYGIEYREDILNDPDELSQFSQKEQNYIKNSGYDYFIADEEVKPSNFIAPDDIATIADNLANDVLD